jgi:hypothetical protein
MNGKLAANTKLAEAVAQAQQQQQNASVNPNSVANFRNETILCGNCYGDLFVI